MLNFDRDRFVGIQSGAVGIAADVRSLIAKLLADDVERLYFMGTGGVQLLTLPAVELLQQRSTFPVAALYPAQVVLDPPAGLDDKAVVVIPSLSGTTKESVEALAFLKARGVRTISLTGHADTPVAQDADHNFTNFAEDDTSSESFYLQTLLIALALLAETRRSSSDYDRIVAELQTLPDAPGRRQGRVRGRCRRPRRGDQGRAVPHLHRRGLGLARGLLLRHVHLGGDAVDPHPSGPCRRLLPRHPRTGRAGRERLRLQGRGRQPPARPTGSRTSPGATPIGSACSTRRPSSCRASRPTSAALISPVVLATLLERLSAHLEVLRDHPLTTRRYYKRVEY